jgi:hypothetical protein
MSPLETKLERLRSSLLATREVLVAFSGGVDSSFLVRVAHDTLGRGARALTSVSPTNPDEDTKEALGSVGEQENAFRAGADCTLMAAELAAHEWLGDGRVSAGQSVSSAQDWRTTHRGAFS